MCAIFDLLLTEALLAIGFDPGFAHTAAFLAAALAGLLLNARSLSSAEILPRWGRWLLDFAMVAMLAYLARAALVIGLADQAGWSPAAAVIPGIVVAAIVNGFGTGLASRPPERVAGVFSWPAFSVCVVCYALLMRIVFAGSIDLLPEESYYWAYAQQLDLGYLDHPPMVAWLIWLGTWLLGNDELGVRLPALGCWIVTALFMYRLAENLFDRITAVRVLLLVSVLPIYFSVGLVTTPDAPLFAAWAGSLYYLERALVARRYRAWLGAGACLGLGMLSKYTVALLAPAVLIYVLQSGAYREVLRRPEPYAAAALAALVFSPVIVWNASHDWASFVFQGPERWAGPAEFSLHVLVGYVMLLLTPVGLVGIPAALIAGTPSTDTKGGSQPDPRYRFSLVFTLTPLVIFLVHSLHGETKLNWTGPVWLAALPLLAWHIGAGHADGWGPFNRRLWGSVAITCVLTYGVCLHYIQLGLPGYSLPGSMTVPVAWKEMAGVVEQISRQAESETGAEPLVVGLDKYFISSEFAFYDPDGDGFEETSGRHLFGGSSLMWSYWHPASAAKDRNVVVIAFDPDRLAHPSISCRFQMLGPITEHGIDKRDRRPAHFYARVGYIYDPAGQACDE